MFTLLLLLSKVGMLVAMLNGTVQTVTVSKNLTEQENITDIGCGEQCDVKCHLRNQNFDVLPTCLPRTIEDLDLSFNNITVVEDQEVADLSKLRTLSLSHNQIKEIHWSIHVLGELELLDLSYNQISVVPKCLMLKNLRKLSLAGNPIVLIQPFAFSCFPNLVSLNLSSTLIGINSSEVIEESAFALNVTQGQEDSLNSLHILDLSGTYLRSVNHSWSKDLPNLRELHIRKMIVLEVLEDELIEWFPLLQILNCADSKRLHYIRTEIFENAAVLKYLYFQNCNLRSLSQWNISSLQASLNIDLRGNPLLCNCDLDWMFSHSVNQFLYRPHETFCTYLKGDLPTISMLELHERCKLHDPNIDTQDSVTSNTTVMEPDVLSGTTEDSMNSTLTPHTTGRKYILPESTTDENDSLSITPSGMVSPTMRSSSASDISPKELTLSISTTEGPLTEHKFTESGSSNGDQSEILKDYAEDYFGEETQPSITTTRSTMLACDYDHCRHLQTPCFELQLQSSCFCPGLSGEHELPEPPYVQEVLEITDTSAQIRWCSPNSMVEKYQLVYQPESGANETVDNIYVTMRQHTLYNLAPYTTYKACVMAFNKKGHSAPTNVATRTPCAEFRTRPSYILVLSLLSALGGVFLVTIAVLSTCLYKTCKNNSVSKYDTRLVSYKNPAFEYHCTIPSYH